MAEAPKKKAPVPRTSKKRKPSDSEHKGKTNVPSRRGATNKAWWPTIREYNEIYEMIAEGTFVKDVIEHIGICSHTFYRKMNSDDPRMLDELGRNKLKVIVDEAREASCQPLISIVYQKALNGNDPDQMQALKWYLEKIGGYGTNKYDLNVTTNAQPIDITPQEISDALKQLKRGETYEHDPDT